MKQGGKQRTLQPFVEYVAKAPPDEVHALCAEDIALCAAWHASCAANPGLLKACNGLQDTLSDWAAHMTPPNHESEGSRQQPVLRGLVNRLRDGQAASLNRDEIEFLCAVYDLMQRADHPDFFQRPIEALAPFIDQLRRRQADEPLQPGLPRLSQRYMVITGEEIERARPREIRILSGVHMPNRGPVFMHRGDLKVIDFVPENSVLVVEQGACYVNGFVLGKVLATNHCEVRENISGAVIVSEGDVRVRNIVNKAVVIAKQGQVRCRQAMEPNLVFAGKSLWVAENATRGHYLAPYAEFNHEVVGGEVEVSKEAKAQRFRPDESVKMCVVLRRKFTSEDYGEAISAEVRRLIARATRLRERYNSFAQMARLAEDESEQFAASALIFLCGGDNTKHLLDEIERDQRRLSFLERVISGLEALSRQAEDNLFASAQSAGGDELVRSTTSSAQGSLDQVELEMRELESEGAIDEDLSAERAELFEMGKDLDKSAPDAKVTSTFVARLSEKEANWLRERRELLEGLRVKKAHLRQTVGRIDLLEKAGEDVSKVQLLRRFLVLAKQRGGADVLGERLQSPFIRLQLRAINSRLDRIREYKENLFSIQDELDSVTEQLKSQRQFVDFEDADSGPPRVHGCFGAGVRVCAEQAYEKESESPPGSYIVTPDTGAQPATYVREHHLVFEAS